MERSCTRLDTKSERKQPKRKGARQSRREQQEQRLERESEPKAQCQASAKEEEVGSGAGAGASCDNAAEHRFARATSSFESVESACLEDTLSRT
jgi:hypothetical protein